MKKTISKVVAGIITAVMVVALTVYADTKITGSKTTAVSGVVDSIGTGGYTNVGIIINMTQMDSLYFKIEGADRQGVDRWFNLDSSNATTTFNTTTGDSTVCAVYNGWVPYVRFNIARLDTAVTGGSLTYFWILWKE